MERSNQVCARFLELFPKAKRKVDRSDSQNKIYLLGVKFKDGKASDNPNFHSPNNGNNSNYYTDRTDENTNFHSGVRTVSSNSNSNFSNSQCSPSPVKVLEKIPQALVE